MTDKYPAGALVAITGVDPAVIRRICRVVEDRGATILVESDSEIEGDAAVEYDFPTPEPCSMEVPRSRVRPIVAS